MHRVIVEYELDELTEEQNSDYRGKICEVVFINGREACSDLCRLSDMHATSFGTKPY